MKPTQEQLAEWVQTADDLTAALTLAYEAGRKDENEACAEMVKNWKPEFFEHMTQEYAVHFIRQRREQ